MGDGLRVSGHDGQIPDDRGEIASSRCLATLMGLTFLLVPSSCDRSLKWVNGVCSSSKEYYSFLFSGLDNLAMGKKDFLLLLLLLLSSYICLSPFLETCFYSAFARAFGASFWRGRRREIERGDECNNRARA